MSVEKFFIMELQLNGCGWENQILPFFSGHYISSFVWNLKKNNFVM